MIGGESVNLVAYSAGAVAFMFLLFASVHGAVSLLEEQESGILDRVLAGPGGIGVLVNGKFLYVVGQGLVQVAVIFTVAWLVYEVDLPGHFGPWLVVSMAASVASAGLAMLLATACQTRRQAQTVANTRHPGTVRTRGEHGAALPHAGNAEGSRLVDAQHLGTGSLQRDILAGRGTGRGAGTRGVAVLRRNRGLADRARSRPPESLRRLIGL